MSNDIVFIADYHNSDFADGSRQSPANEVTDLLRRSTGNYWISGNASYKSLAKDVYTQDFDAYGANLAIASTGFEVSNWDGECVEGFKVVLYGQDTRTQRNRWLEWFREQLEEAVIHRDHCTEVSVYESSSNKKEESLGLLNLYCNVGHEYNYYHTKYESKVADLSIPETDLPNFYNSFFRTFPELYSLGGSIDLPPGDSPYFPNNQYLNDWAENYDDWRSTDAYGRYDRIFNTVGFSKNIIPRMNDIYLSKELFPMCATVEFVTERDSELADIIEKTRFSQHFHHIISQGTPRSHRTSEVLVNQSTTGNTQSSEIRADVSRHFYDVSLLFAETSDPARLPESAYFGGDAHIQPRLEDMAYYQLMALITQGKIQKIKKEKYRKWSEIIEGKTAYSEPVYYELEKRDENGELVQKFRFANTTDVDIIKFVDTQVKYNKQYTYSLHSWNIVIGTKYHYNLDSAEGNELYFLVTSTPDIMMMRADLMSSSVWLMDSPPVNPDVEIIPIVGKSDRVRIHFNSPPGKFTRPPITFSSSENDMIERIRESQGIPDDVESITYDSDDNISKFVVYRTDFLPSNYRQFEIYGKIIEVTTEDVQFTGITGTDTRGTSASVMDNISPNKKYYYCFRSVDVHGHYSYPTDIYKVELVDDQGSIYPIIEYCEIEQPKSFEETRSFKRFMQVSPSISNLIPDDEHMGISWNEADSGPELGDNVKLGISEDKVWGKKFKIRLKSKTTGRALDFDFTFEQEKKI